MQVKVPKFIDVEDRVVGPLTWKQFVYLALAVSFTFVVYSFFEAYLAFPLAAVALGLAIGLAFAKINGRPLKVFLTTLWRFHFNPRRYFWEKELPARKTAIKQHAVEKTPQAPRRVSPEDLKRIAAALDIGKRIERSADYGEEMGKSEKPITAQMRENERPIAAHAVRKNKKRAGDADLLAALVAEDEARIAETKIRVKNFLESSPDTKRHLVFPKLDEDDE